LGSRQAKAFDLAPRATSTGLIGCIPALAHHAFQTVLLRNAEATPPSSNASACDSTGQLRKLKGHGLLERDGFHYT
jgi:hypothetical protein